MSRISVWFAFDDRTLSFSVFMMICCMKGREMRRSQKIEACFHVRTMLRDNKRALWPAIKLLLLCLTDICNSIMSQSTQQTNLDFQECDSTPYHDIIFSQLPIALHADSQQSSNGEQAVLKLRWLIEYLVGNIKSKSKIKEMMKAMTDISLDSQAKQQVLKRLCQIKSMFKHCQVAEIAPLLTDTLLLTAINRQK